MRIALDAKRAFHNATGLGTYSRNLINGFAELKEQEHDYFLFTPKVKVNRFANPLPEQFKLVENTSLIKPYWRSFSIASDLLKKKIELYHGLSNELPFTLTSGTIKKVVTIHDLLYLRFPNMYPILDRNIYFHKATKSCKLADKIIATSEATKQDIIEFMKVPEEKIAVVYQSCSPTFYQKRDAADLEKLREKYGLPMRYILHVGRLEERKNLRLTIHALAKINKMDRLPLVVVGRENKFKQVLVKLAKELDVTVYYAHGVEDEELPVMYQNASLFIYASFFEGFGIPVLEAMASRIPVLTSKKTSMAEIVADENCLLNAYDTDEIASKIKEHLVKDNSEMIEKNYQKSLEFTNMNFAKNTLKVYDSI